MEFEEQIDKGKAKLKLKQADVKAQTARVSHSSSRSARSRWPSSRIATSTRPPSCSSPTTPRASSARSPPWRRSARTRTRRCRNYQQEQARLADSELSAETDLAALAEQEKQLKALRKASDKKIAESKAVLAKLWPSSSGGSPMKSGGRSPRPRTTPSATIGTTSRMPTKTSVTSPAATGGGRGAKALAFARAQLGKPYRYASSGPNAYDCSGLTDAAWRSVGRQPAPHVAQPVRRRAAPSPSPTCSSETWCSSIRQHQPRRALRRERYGHSRAAAWQGGPVHQDELHAVRRRQASRLITAAPWSGPDSVGSATLALCPRTVRRLHDRPAAAVPPSRPRRTRPRQRRLAAVRRRPSTR